MSEAVREATPVEVLERDIKDILSRPLKEEIMKQEINNVIAKAMCYEHDYYNHQYTVISAQLKDQKEEVEVMRTQNRILTKYIMMKEQEV